MNLIKVTTSGGEQLIINVNQVVQIRRVNDEQSEILLTNNFNYYIRIDIDTLTHVLSAKIVN